MTRLLLLFLLALPFLAEAQIVNIESKRKNISADTIGWFGAADAGFNLNNNGKTVLTLSSSLNVEYLRKKHLWLALTDFQLVRLNSEAFVNKGFQHFRYNYALKKRVTWEAFTQVQYNERLRIRFRSLVGTGPRFQLLAAPKNQVYFGALYMYQYEEIGEAEIIYRDHRLSSYLSYSLAFSPQVSFSGTSYYQPLLNDFSSARISSQNSFVLKISSKWSFQSTFSVSFDSRLADEAEDIPATTYSWVNGLKWVF